MAFLSGWVCLRSLAGHASIVPACMGTVLGFFVLRCGSSSCCGQLPTHASQDQAIFYRTTPIALKFIQAGPKNRPMRRCQRWGAGANEAMVSSRSQLASSLVPGSHAAQDQILWGRLWQLVGSWYQCLTSRHPQGYDVGQIALSLDSGSGSYKLPGLLRD